MRRIAITCWIIAAILVLIGWQFRDRIMWQVGLEGASLFREINSESELHEALLDEHGVIIFEFDWSLHDKVIRKELDEFARDWHYSGHSPKIAFYSVNLTYFSELPASQTAHIREWIASTPQIPQSTYHGIGGVVYLKSGHVVDFVSRADYFFWTAVKLTELARDNFRN